jgi:hypothetical protein
MQGFKDKTLSFRIVAGVFVINIEIKINNRDGRRSW